MSFRNATPKPLAHLFGPGEMTLECRLIELHPKHLIGFIPDADGLAENLPMSANLALTPRRKPGEQGTPARVLGKARGQDRYIIALDDPKSFWESALETRTHNRRQAFRVQTKDYGSVGRPTKMGLTSTLRYDRATVTVELLNLSATGCNILMALDPETALPRSKSSVTLTLEGPTLKRALHIDAQVQRLFSHSKAPRLALLFRQQIGPEGVELQQQLQAYLMEHQREQIRFRAG